MWISKQEYDESGPSIVRAPQVLLDSQAACRFSQWHGQVLAGTTMRSRGSVVVFHVLWCFFASIHTCNTFNLRVSPPHNHEHELALVLRPFLLLLAFSMN